jgi:hypothetical protein
VLIVVVSALVTPLTEQFVGACTCGQGAGAVAIVQLAVGPARVARSAWIGSKGSDVVLRLVRDFGLHAVAVEILGTKNRVFQVRGLGCGAGLQSGRRPMLVVADKPTRAALTGLGLHRDGRTNPREYS